MRGDLLVKSRIVVKFADIANILPLTTATVIMNRVLRFYVDGFKSMTIGRKLWALIIIKLIIIFVILKLFFFSETTDSRAKAENITPAEYVRSRIIRDCSHSFLNNL